MRDVIRKAISHKGFSVVEILSQCPTYFGRKNRLGSTVDMLHQFKDQTTTIGSKAKQENPDLLERGIFVQKELPEYCTEYEKIIERAKA
jgi:2-oxoglutarate ferredoxin oxidoreductase subunit beta